MLTLLRAAAEDAGREAAARVAVWALVAIFALAAGGFATAAAYGALAARFDPTTARLTLAGAFALLALIVWLAFGRRPVSHGPHVNSPETGSRGVHSPPPADSVERLVAAFLAGYRATRR